jgi:type I restriction enzyme S subunit
VRSGWTSGILGELCQIRPPKSEARNRLKEGDLVSFAGMEQLGIDRKFLETTQVRRLESVNGSYTYFADGDVLLAKITPCFENGKLGIASALENGIGFGSSEFVVLRPNHALDKEFLHYYLGRPEFRSEGEARMGGAVGQQRIPKDFIDNYLIPLPPISEQRRIVGILDEVFDDIAVAKANAERNLKNARALFESYLHSVFAGPQTSWLEKTLEESVATNCTLSYGIVQPGGDYAGGLPIVRPMDLTEKVIQPDGLKRINPKLAKAYQRTILLGDDLLLCVRGSTGLVSVASTKLAGANVTRGIVPIRFDQTVLKKELGFYVMSSEPVQTQIREKTYGAALRQINIRDLRKVVLRFPPLEQQYDLVTMLDELALGSQCLESIYRRKLVALEELKKSLLNQAFAGEL